MPENYERDGKLIGHGYVSGVRTFRNELREWIQEQIIESKLRAQSLVPTLTGEIQKQMSQASQRLDEIDMHELREAIENIDTKCKEIEDGAWINVLDARPYLEEGVTRLESLVRELLKIRDFINTFWEGIDK